MVDEPDEFSKIFDDLSKITGEKDTVLTPLDEPPPVVVGQEPPPGETIPVQATELDEGLLDKTPPADEPPPVDEPPPAPEPAPRDDDLLARFAQIVREQPQPQPQLQPPPPAPEPPLFTPDEQKVLQDYEKDWPDVAKAEALRRRAEYRQLLGYVFEQVSHRLAPLEQMTVGGAERSHLNDIYALIPDYDQVRDPVLNWIGKQPAYVRSAYEAVAQRGTPAEIADMVNRYRQETGTRAPSAPTPPPAPAPQVRKAAAALAPVKSARSGVTDSQPEDFDGAFAAFAKSV